MIKITSVAEKPNRLVPWNKKLNYAVIDHIQNTYKNTGKFISAIHTFSNNNTIQTSIFLFNSEEDFIEYRNDPALSTWMTSLRDHRTMHNIVLTKYYLIEPISIHDPYVLTNYGVFTIVSLDDDYIDEAHFIED